MSDAALLVRVKELFIVNLENGTMFNKVNRGPRSMAGCEVGTAANDGYLRVCIDGKLYLRHRLIFLVAHGYLPQRIDHINQRPGDDMIANLREATQSFNGMNTSIRIDNTSGEKGVSWHSQRSKWQTYVTVNGARVFSKLFTNKSEAIAAVRAAREIHHGAFNGDIQRLQASGNGEVTK